MFSIIINPIPLLFTIATTFGVLIHDTQLDRAAKVALSMPVAFATYAAADAAIKSSEHVHVERVSIPANLASLRSMTPRLQPRDDNHRYAESKKLHYSGGDNGYAWPSI
ncbi:MAG: hypothetical protein WA030_03215 [Candidatus Microsaccharimonas sp.]